MGQYILMVLKFIGAILMLPLVFASVYCLNHHLHYLPGNYETFLLYGVVAFLLIFLFIYQFWSIYEFGQNVMADLIKFTAPVDRILVRLLPFYMICVMLIFYITDTFLKISRYDPYFMFFIGFTGSMHILLTAQDLQDKEQTPFKPSYLFLMAIVFIFNVVLFVLFMDVIVGKWSFGGFLDRLVTVARHMYLLSFDKIPIFK